MNTHLPILNSLDTWIKTWSTPDFMFVLFTGLLILFGIIWAACLLVRFLNDLFGNTLRPANETSDEGHILDSELTHLGDNIGKAVDILIQKLKTQINSFVDEAVSNLNGQIEDSRSQMKDLFSRESDILVLDRALADERKVQGSKMAEFNHKWMVMVRQLSLQADFEKLINQTFKPLVDKSPNNLILLKKSEDLRFEPGDTLTVKVAKFVRRAFRWAERKLGMLMKPLHWQKKDNPMVYVRQIPFQSFFKKRLDQNFLIEFKPVLRELEQTPVKMQAQFLEIARILRFNLESASADLEELTSGQSKEKVLQAAQQTTLGAYDRISLKLDSIQSDKEKFFKEFEAELIQAAEQSRLQISRDCEFADTIGEFLTRFWEQLKHYGRARYAPLLKQAIKIKEWLKNGFRLSQKQVDWIRKGLGMAAPTEARQVGELDHATLVFAQRNLPPIYRRVFKFSPLIDDEFFVGRTREISLLEEARKRWESGGASSIAISGPIGSGKTSLIQCALLRFFSGKKVYSLTLTEQINSENDLIKMTQQLFSLPPTDERISLADLASTLRHQQGRAVVVLEGAQHLFQRKIGGFAILHDFLEFMSKTMPDFLWIVSVSEVGWAYLNFTKKISKQFLYHVSCTNMGSAELEKIIWMRHSMTGYNLEFSEEGVPLDLKWRLERMKKNLDKQILLKKEYFDTLYDITGGNIYSAFYYWLCSSDFKEDQKIIVRFPRPIGMDWMRHMTPYQLSTLLAVLQHGSISAELHSAVFRFPVHQSRDLLNELLVQNILHSSDQNRFWPNPIIIPAALKVLRERNLVYH